MDILDGNINDDTVMPMLGITTEKEAIHRDIESSKNDPAKQAELMAKAKNKIDVFVSQLDAFVAFEKNRENLTYYYQ